MKAADNPMRAHVTFNYRGKEAVVLVRGVASETARLLVAQAIGAMIAASIAPKIGARDVAALCVIVVNHTTEQTSWTFDLAALTDVELEAAERGMRGIGPSGRDCTDPELGTYYRTFAVLR